MIYLLTSAECAGPINRPTAVKGLDFIKKLNWWNLIFFAVLLVCIFHGFLNVWCFWKSLPNRAAITEPSNWSVRTLASIINKKHTILTKRPPIATTVRSRPEQSLHHPGALLHRWLQAPYRVYNGRPAFNYKNELKWQ